MKRIWLLLLFFVITGCSERDLGPFDAGADVYESKDLQTDNGQFGLDTIQDATEIKNKSCPVSDSVFGNIFSIDPAGPDTQIHAAAAYDGTGIWVVYNRPGSDSNFEVWAVRLACDGTPLVKPFRVNHESGYNDTDPALAVNANVVMFAWQEDNGQSPNNLSVRYRSFNIDGSPLMAADHVLDLTGGLAEGQNSWMVKLAALPDAKFALVSAVGAKGYQGFQVWMQIIDQAGSNVGSGLLPAPEKGVTQTFPTVASDMVNTIYIAWQRESNDDSTDVGVRMVSIPIIGTVKDPVQAFDPYSGHRNQAPDYTSTVQGGLPWMAFQTSGQTATHIAVRNGRDFSAASVILDDGPGMNHTPAVVSVQNGGAIVWYRQLSGIKNEVRFQEFQTDTAGNPIMLGKSVQLNTNPAAPYQPAIAALPDGYFVAWSEGKSPAFRINGVFVHKSDMQITVLYP